MATKANPYRKKARRLEETLRDLKDEISEVLGDDMDEGSGNESDDDD